MKISALVSLAFMFIASFAMAADAPSVILLWPNGAPGSEGKTTDEVVKLTANGERIVTGVNKPSVMLFLPNKQIATGVGVLIAPGGGHSQLSYDSEGCYVGEWLAQRGIAGFVLTNRLAREKGSTYTIEGDELPDTQRAMRLIRSHATEWSVDPDRLGMIGFSAGGELVNLLVEKNDDGNPQAADAIDRFSCKPAFEGLLYPGNSKAILPTSASPPAFLVCGAKDRPDISEGLPNVYLLFKKAGVPVELHIYANTGHGFGYRPASTTAANQWPFRFQEWLITTGFLKKRQVATSQPATQRGGQ
jgi:endo-1,4-beta-xylanase